MAKTYTIPATSMYSGYRSSWTDVTWVDLSLTTSSVKQFGYMSSTNSGLRCVNFMFDSATLESMRTKPVTSIKFYFKITASSIKHSYVKGIDHKYNAVAYTTSTGNSWATGSGGVLGRGKRVEFDQGYTEVENQVVKCDLTAQGIPEYGYVVGPTSSTACDSYTTIDETFTPYMEIETSENESVIHYYDGAAFHDGSVYVCNNGTLHLGTPYVADSGGILKAGG